jgi:UPF0271 protein
LNKIIDINCDVGEGFENEADLMPYISSCSIACGAHAGDEETITKTINLALQYNVKIGAHPSFPDRANFGRKVLDIPINDLKQSLKAQIKLIKSSVEGLGGKLNHVKAHGALYNFSANDRETAEALIEVVKNTTNEVFLYVPYGSLIETLAKQNGLNTKVEAFADRNYNTNLTLVSRSEQNAVITDPELVAKHLMNIILDEHVISIDGVGVKMKAQTYCVHGDNPSAISILKKVSKILQENGIKIV